ncbi:phosphoribosyl-ATP diphosphatase [Sphingorhabdus lutea]|uniref:Phosphoribosyl-ATP pyrophosphatase n=1 Tax=Sphingorhabdus lutea TaxID=1913578 RepID=A0A1L3JAM4_9SPHN|nr:phosphoribosyl-ATP diphosphatase [Sphingorhabdus lutea]APG62184.1 phosphoribosyl-ATP diphosphatase [Sphingorhabdus lutea]
MSETIDRLEEVIRIRRKESPKKSYVAKLRSKGRQQIAKKLGEEAVEVVIAAMLGKKKQVIAESADMMFHHLMLLADMGLSIHDVFAELESRKGMSGLEEKANRKDG